MKDPTSLEERVEALLLTATASTAEWQPLLGELYQRYRTQERLLDRITHISDQFQRAERDRGRNHAEELERKIRQIEKIVRISDRYQSMLYDLKERLTAISSHDELTALPNRRFMQESLQREIAKIVRHGGTFSIALADVDHFKQINDSAGHACGDAVLARLAACLRANLREYDCCARWGGEEFLLLFPACSAKQALLLAERMRLAVANIDTATFAPDISLSISLGVAEYDAETGLDATLRMADEALYQAKAEGRNRSVMHAGKNAA